MTGPKYTDSSYNNIENNPNKKIFLNNGSDNNNIKISIVMAYYNRLEQIETTLDTIQNSTIKNIEVIIIDDGSDDGEYLKMMIYKYNYSIKLYIIEKNKKNWINPCIPYNIGFYIASGDIIIIQNPEVCHVGDVIKYVNDNINEDSYMVFSVFASPSFIHNTKIKNDINRNIQINFINEINYNDYKFDYGYYKEKYYDIQNLKEHDAFEHWNKIGIFQGRKCNKNGIYHPDEYIKWNGWYNHPKYNNRPLHFISAITKNNLKKIGGFDNSFKDGLWYDDDDFLHRIQKICKLVNVDDNMCYGIHLYHNSGSSDQINTNNFKYLSEKNKRIYENNIKNNTIEVNMENGMMPYDYLIDFNYLYDNKVLKIENYKIGLIIKTYSDDSTSSERLNIINECFESIKNIEKYVDIYVMIDGNCIEKHENIINKYRNIYKNQYNVLKSDINRGISGITNYAMKYLIKNGYNIGICCDDDVIFKENFVGAYVEQILRSGFEHFSYYPYKELIKINKEIGGFLIKNIKMNECNIINYKNAYAGCMFTFTYNILKNIGYMPVFKYKYGYEHEIFSINYSVYKNVNNNGQYDIQYSDKYINLNDKSFYNKSFAIDHTSIKQNLIESKNIINGKSVEYNDNDKLISIIIPYYNNLNLLNFTIESIKQSKYQNYEIIIVNDCSADYNGLIYIKEKYFFIDIKIINIDINEKKDRINRCVPFNIGISHAKGEIIILQNPELYHNGDILSYVKNNLHQGKYLIFSVYNMESKESNDIFLNLKNKNYKFIEGIISTNRKLKWLQHPLYRNLKYHFCSAIYKSDILMIGGFDEEYAKGCCYDDDDFVFKMEKNICLDIITLNHIDKPFAVYMNYAQTLFTNNKKKVLINRSYFEKKINSINNNFVYPRIMHLYLINPLSFMNYITILSFNKYNPSWLINVYVSKRYLKEFYSMDYDKKSKNYFDELKKLSYVNVINIDDIISNFKIENSDYSDQMNVLKYYYLYNYGGYWGKIDIIYTKNIEIYFADHENPIVFECRDPINNKSQYLTEIILSRKKNELFDKVLKRTELSNDNKIINTIFENILINNNYDINIYNNEYYIPIKENEIDKLYHENNFELSTNIFGVTYYYKSSNCIKYIESFDISKFKVDSFIDYLIEPYIGYI